MLGGRLGVRSKTGEGEGNHGTEMFLFLRLSEIEAPLAAASTRPRVQVQAKPDKVPHTSATVAPAEVCITVPDDSSPFLERKEDDSLEYPPSMFPAVLRVMVVDDNNINRKLLGRGLKKLLGKRIASGKLPGCKKLEINEVDDGGPAVEWEANHSANVHAGESKSYHHVITMGAHAHVRACTVARAYT